TAIIHRTQRCEVDLAAVLGRRAFDLDRILAIEPNFLSEDDHEHDDAVKSVCLRTDRPLDGSRLTRWLQRLLGERGQDLLRTKGILSIAGQDKQFVVQAVHMLMEGDFTKPWRPEESRESRLVFIGRNIDEPELRRQFDACIA
ncbi:MAG: GTP-binding protein, partial [Nitratireductor sp.]